MSYQEDNKKGVVRRVLRYALLPDLKSRFRELGFNLSTFTYLFACFFAEAKLIENTHPCLRQENIGRYRMRDVLRMAMKNLTWDWYHVPQIAMFFAIVASIVLAVAMFVVSMTYFFVSTAHAQMSVMSVDRPEDEFALQFLAKVFGNTGLSIFDPDEATATYSWLTVALGEMLQMYSNLLLFIGGIIVLYYIVVVVVESAQTGVPLGQRFSVWAPIRLCLAIALLVPFSGVGYNGAQLIVFQSVAWGSNLASNIWETGMGVLTEGNCNPEIVGEVVEVGPDCLVAPPVYQPDMTFIRGLFLIRTCQLAYNRVSENALHKDRINVRVTEDEHTGSYVYSYGTKTNPDFCGAIRIAKIQDRGDTVIISDIPLVTYTPNGAAADIQWGYKSATFAVMYGTSGVVDLSGDNNSDYSDIANDGEIEGYGFSDPEISILDVASTVVEVFRAAGELNDSTLIDEIPPGVVLSWRQTYLNTMLSLIEDAADNQNKMAPDLVKTATEGGWANAGAFYLRLAELNGSMQTSLAQKPELIKGPTPHKQPCARMSGPPKCSRNLLLQTNPYSTETMRDVSAILDGADHWFQESPKRDGTGADLDLYGSFALQTTDPDDGTGRTSGVSSDAVFNFFGSGLAKMMYVDNEMNPLGSLSSMGANLVAVALTAWTVGAAAMMWKWTVGLGGIIMFIGTALIAAGVALWIVLPILPYVYFTFAVVNWVIAIFEAIVGAPLWALSFLRIDGDGITGPGAMNGVYLVFMLFLHPTLIIFGLIGTILVFSAAASFINATFSIVLETIMADRDGGSGLMVLLYVIVYVVIMYSLGQSIFKMIDRIPQGMLRFLGQGSPETFSELVGDDGQVEKYVAVIAAGRIASFGQKVGGAGKQLTETAESSGGTASSDNTKSPGGGTGGVQRGS